MTDDDLMKASIDLRRILFGEIRKFWEEHSELDVEKVFFINSVVMSSLISQIVFMLFKKTENTAPQCDYIDQICEFSKKMLMDGKLLIESEMISEEHGK